MSSKQFVNEDRADITKALANGLSHVPLGTSPLLRALGCHFSSGTPGDIRISFHPGSEHVQGHGVVSGGTIATMLDFAMAFAALSRLAEGESAVSVALNVAYLGAVKPEKVIAHAQVTTMGYRLAHAQAQLLTPQGDLLASAQSPLALQRAKS
ncbi:PaaI family thioesterase [Lutimaribacter sp. EGI FJ00015]|uniref:PaaI family thioesterase n=1 Tax=Lutimaribacter degradans TaxID=2945989 RepID=A0ACC5ZVD6_9RHOB|nr:PaaI family thioesterase [Lutimaribacter sp. EGI FJ00013]MCM2562294.1 PaaI family thioesterase [Lutimaribacter sp. EGI FJ00013]MCO0613449.1 PaaI family thioesterase [Lutimaribacter sp. EGI FJ00015]MCO0636423.1 PaaI family thioesterase [Lutimaribacter sp. EGI FJ00014]